MPAQVELAIWDTAGQERFHALGPIYYRDAQAALLVYDITDADSFTRVQTWVQELRQMVSHQASCKLMTLSALTCQLLSLHTCLYLQLNCNYPPCLHQPLSFAIRHLLLLLFLRKMQHGVLSDIQSKSFCMVFICRASGLRTGSLQCKLQISLSIRYGTSSLYSVLLLCIENRLNLPSPPPK